MARDWRVVVDDTGGPFSGWPSVCSETEDRCVLHQHGFRQEFWEGPTKQEALEIAQLVADHMNRKGGSVRQLPQEGRESE